MRDIRGNEVSHHTTHNKATEKASNVWVFACIALGVASLATFFLKETPQYDFWGLLNILKIVVYCGFIIALLVISRGMSVVDTTFHSLPRWIRRLTVVLPMLAVAFAIINAAFPDISWLVRMGDNNIFLRPGALLRVIFELVACGYFMSLIPRFVRQKNWLGVTLVTGVSLILFVMGMEEISWGQRIFEWETSGYFADHNVQGETNLHNLATQLFQNVLFFGGFLLLVVMPFFHTTLVSLFKRFTPLRSLTVLLPEQWMIIAFGAGLMFVDPVQSPYGIHWGSISFQLLATLAFLAMLVWRLRQKADPQYSAALRTLICALIVVILSLSFETLWLQYNQGLPTEYLKLYIIFGILCWAIRVRKRVQA